MRSNLQRYRCAICATEFAKKDYLITHHKTHQPHQFRCAVCAKTFATISACRGHEIRHSDANKRFRCQYCRRQFFSSSERARHERSRAHKADVARVPCPICGKTFSRQRSVNDHLRMHGGDHQIYGCAQCPAQFAYKSTIVKHLRMHTDRPEGAVCCPHCSVRFGRRHDLTKHLRLHDVASAPDSRSNGHSTAVLTQPTPPPARRGPRPKHYSSVQVGLPCPACGEKFPNAYRLKLHRLSLHRRSPRCDVCGAEFSNENYLMQHRTVHTASSLERPVACAQCGGRFKDKSNLAHHIRSFHRPKHSFICAQCGAVLPTYNQLRSHVVKHRPDKPFECIDFCGARFATRKELTMHRRVHTREKPFACNLCLRRFAQLCNLRKHLLVHQRRQDSRCNVCQRWFARHSQLAAHALSHVADGALVRYGCSICESYHGRRQSLILHIAQMHNNEDGFTCPVCSKRFRAQRSLHDHCARNSHDWNNDDGRLPEAGTDAETSRIPPPPTYRCAICSNVWRDVRLFTAHFLQEHRHQRVQCNVCTVFLHSPAALEQHLQRHAADAKPFACQLCQGKRFASRRALIRHGSFEHPTPAPEERIFKCSSCSKSFALASSLRQHSAAVHTEHRPFECPVCHHKSATSSNFKVHLLCHSSEAPYACAVCTRKFKLRSRLQAHLARCGLRTGGHSNKSS